MSKAPFVLSWLVAIALVTAMVPAGAGDSHAPTDLIEEACMPHPPIVINEEEGPRGFILGHDPTTGEPIHRPASGVRAGSGTSEDPYIIEGWCIQDYGAPFLWAPILLGVPPPIPHGIHIEDTHAHVEIRDNVLTGQHLTAGPADGLLAQTGVLLREVSNVHVHNNAIQANGLGILAEGTQSVTITDNHVHDGLDGVKLDDAHGSLVEANVIEDNAQAGIDLVDATANTIRSNTVTGHGWHGVLLIDATHGNTIASNLLQGNQAGLKAWAEDNDVVENTIEGNGVGLETNPQLEDPIHVQSNWWGDDSGPSGGVFDACEGTLANGQGDAIAPSTAQVCFDAWLEEPNPNAGAG